MCVLDQDCFIQVLFLESVTSCLVICSFLYFFVITQNPDVLPTVITPAARISWLCACSSAELDGLCAVARVVD